jgi:hypothetical protein
MDPDLPVSAGMPFPTLAFHRHGLGSCLSEIQSRRTSSHVVQRASALNA